MIPYQRRLFYSKEDGGFIATMSELPGCSAFGKTPGAALKEVEKAAKLWIQAAKKEKRELPEAIMSKKCSGRFALRMPQALHRELEQEASEQGVSLNQWIIYKLAQEHPRLRSPGRRVT